MKKKCWIMALLLMLVLSGCTPLPLVPRSIDQITLLPTPEANTFGEAPIGDDRKEHSERINMFYPNADADQLHIVARTVTLSGNDTMIDRVLERLLELPAPGSRDISPIVPSGTRVLSLDVSGGVATLNLSADARQLSAEQQLYMRAGIANTLIQLPGIRYVNVLIGGQVESLSADQLMPTGLSRSVDTDLSTLWAQTQSDIERFRAGRTGRQLDATAALYFLSASGDRLLCEPRQMRFNNDDLVVPLLRELVRGPSEQSEARAVLPNNLEPLERERAPEIITSSDGQRLITLPFTDEFRQQLRQQGISMKQLCGALTLTLTRFVPEIDGVQVLIGGKLITQFEDPKGALNAPGGVLRERDFLNMLGDVGHIYLATSENKLSRLNRVMDTLDVQSPRALIGELIEGVESAEELLPVMPEGVTNLDLLGAMIAGDTILLNWSSNFYRCCQLLTETQERLLVYAIVNTLTELPGIKRVQFYIEGSTVENIAHELYLRGPLIRNPGLVDADGTGR